MKKFYEGLGVSVAALFVIAVALFITPLIYVSFGYLGGLIIKWVFGGVLIDGLNILFGTDRFTPPIIPYVTATLAVIGGYFRSSVTNNKK